MCIRVHVAPLVQEKEAFPTEKFDRLGLEGLIKRRFFYGPSAPLYGGRLSND